MEDIRKQPNRSKMGCSLLRQCRRRTQSEPPRNYKPGKQKDMRQHKSYDEVTAGTNSLSSSSSHLTPPKYCINKTEEDGHCKLCEQEKRIAPVPEPNLHCTHSKEKGESFSMQMLLNKAENTLSEPKDIFKTFSLNFQDCPTPRKSTKVDEAASCFPKIGCCRKAKRKERHGNILNVSSCNRKNYDDYTKLSKTASLNSSEYASSLLTASSCITTTSSEKSRTTLFSENSSINLSQDSGFDEPPCFLNIIFQNHKCKGLFSCKKKDYVSLNLHLKALMNCMPKSFSDSEAIQHQLSNCSGVQRDPYLTKRRNAICETSKEMRSQFHEALCAFLTLQAMAKNNFSLNYC